MRMFVMISLLASLFAGCAGTGGSGATSWKRDEWGHRPGPQGFQTVIIDAGHGGKDPGAISRHTGAQEKDLALDTAKRLQRKLSGSVKTVLIRKDDYFVDLDDRVVMASRRDGAILVSLHYNSGPSHVRGPET